MNTVVLESLFNKVAGFRPVALGLQLPQVSFCEFSELFPKSFFKGHRLSG